MHGPIQNIEVGQARGLRRAPSPPKNSEKGSAMVEFALVAALVGVPALLGMTVVGLNMVRAIQVNQVNRDAGHMFATGVDFTQPANQGMLLQIAQGLGFDSNTGNGVIILSAIQKLDAAACGTGPCGNLGYPVITQRIVIGNPAKRASAYGSPPVDGSGHVVNYKNDPNARAAAFSPNVMAMSDGDLAYVAETYLASPDYDVSGYLTGTGVHAQAIF